MHQYVALLRGINVGGHRVKMDRLGELFEELGLKNVSTFIASGNVIFTAGSDDVGALSDEIERHLELELGYDVATFLRSPAQLEAVAAFEPAERAEGEPDAPTVYVVFLRAPASDSLRETFAGLGSATDEFRFAGSEIYWLVQGKISDSPLFGREFDKAIRGVPSTTRNMNTVRRLVEKIRKNGP